MNRHTRVGPPATSVVDSVAGIIPWVLDIEIGPEDPRLFVAAATAMTIDPSRAHPFGKVEGSGAGLTWVGARGAAIGEAVERYSLQEVRPTELLFGSADAMRGDGRDPVSPSDWALFDPMQAVDYPAFRDDTPVAWVRASSLTRKRERLVPACLTYLPYRPAFGRSEVVFAGAISTGAACSSSYVDAVMRGVCEHIERDAFMILWRNRLECPRVRVDEKSALYADYVQRFVRPGLEYILVYTTLDLVIPSFCGILVDSRTDPPGIVVGGAAHPDPNVAALKTLLELVQGLKWKDYEATQTETAKLKADPQRMRSFHDRSLVYAFCDMRHALDFVFHSPLEIALSDIESRSLSTLSANLDLCVQSVAARNMDVLAVDLSTDDVFDAGFRVVRVLVPGCEPMEGDHLLQQLGGRRWRTVPFELGLRPSASTLATVNPIPHPYP